MLGFYQRPHIHYYRGKWWCKSKHQKCYRYNGNTPYSAWWTWVRETFPDPRDVKLVLRTYQ